MQISSAARLAAAPVIGFVLVCFSFSLVSAASTVVNVNVNGVVACDTTSTICPFGSTVNNERAWGFVNPSVSVQYEAQVEDASGQVIPPGGSVSCGQQITLRCLPHQNDDISWFTPGGAFDSPYGTWNTPGAISCVDQYYATTDTGGANEGKVYANLTLPYPTQTITGTTQLTNCTTLADGCSQTCTAVNTGTAPVTVPVAFNYSSVNGNFYGAGQWINSKGEPVDACETPSFALPIKQLAAQYVTSQSLGNGNVWNGFVKAGPGTTDVPIPAAQIAYPITVTPSTNSSSPQCAPSTTTTTNNNNGSCTGNSCLPPSAPTITSAGSQTCTLNSAFTINFTATDPQNLAIQYQVSWNGDGTVNQIVPASGYVPSGTVETATRTFVTTGSHTIEVRAENTDGSLSPWATFTFSCAAGNGLQGDQCTAGPVCQDNQLCQEDASCTVDPTSCTTCAYGCSGNACLPPPSPVLSISAVPDLVQQASTTMVSWSAQNVTSCSVSGTNGDGTGGNTTDGLCTR